MNFQMVLNALQDALRETRSSYHLTLGELIIFLDSVEERGRGGQPVIFGDDYYTYPCDVESYRGYSCDLALTDDGHIDGGATVTTLLNALNAALDREFTGYKGGEFTMDHNTPLWRARYGQAPDHAIVGVEQESTHIGGAVVLKIKKLDADG